MLKNSEPSKNRNSLQVRFGAAVRECRNSLGISQEELAWRAGLHRTYIADIERGVRNITLRSMESVAKALDVPMSNLLVRTGGRAEVPPSLAQDGLGEILLIEDNPADAELAVLAFRRARVTNPIKVIADGQKAVDYLLAPGLPANRRRARLPQLILLDLNLPTLPGLEVLRRLKREALTRDIPVIVLTVSQQDGDLAQCRRLGAAAYLNKPVGFENFSQVISQLSFNWALLKAAPISRPGRRKAA